MPRWKKRKKKLIKLIESLEAAMEERNIQELQHFVNLDFPIEVYCVVEEIIKESINAKGKWFRKFSSKIIITIGHDDNPDNLLGKQRCLEILKEVNEVDLQLLFYMNYIGSIILKISLGEKRKLNA